MLFLLEHIHNRNKVECKIMKEKNNKKPDEFFQSFANGM